MMICTLPVGVIIDILEYLNANCITKLSMSCKFLYYVCTQPIYIRTVSIVSLESVYSKALTKDKPILIPKNIITKDLLGQVPCWRLLNGKSKYQLRNHCDWKIPQYLDICNGWDSWDWRETDPIPEDLKCYNPLQQYQESVERGRMRLERLFVTNTPRKKGRKKSLMMIEIDEQVRLKESPPSSNEKEREKEKYKKVENEFPPEEEKDSRKKIFEEAARIAKSRILKVFSNEKDIGSTSGGRKIAIRTTRRNSNERPKSIRNRGRKTSLSNNNNTTTPSTESDDSTIIVDDIKLLEIASTESLRTKKHRSASRSHKLIDNLPRKREQPETISDQLKARPTSPQTNPINNTNILTAKRRNSVASKVNNNHAEESPPSNTPKSRPLSPRNHRKDVSTPLIPDVDSSGRLSPRNAMPSTGSGTGHKKDIPFLTDSDGWKNNSNYEESASKSKFNLFAKNQLTYKKMKEEKRKSLKDIYTSEEGQIKTKLKKSCTSTDILNANVEQWDVLLNKLNTLDKTPAATPQEDRKAPGSGTLLFKVKANKREKYPGASLRMKRSSTDSQPPQDSLIKYRTRSLSKNEKLLEKPHPKSSPKLRTGQHTQNLATSGSHMRISKSYVSLAKNKRRTSQDRPVPTGTSPLNSPVDSPRVIGRRIAITELNRPTSPVNNDDNVLLISNSND